MILKKAKTHRSAAGPWLTALALLSLFGAPPCAGQSGGKTIDAPEYKLKAAWLVNFLKFVDWPSAPPRRAIVIGILGRDPFGDFFEPYEGSSIAGRKLEIRRYGRFRDNMEEFDCNLLFVTATERKKFERVLERARQRDILTVSEVAGFLDEGGMINFLKVGNRLQYEVNQKAALSEGLRISSQILGRAKHVIKENG